jgi:hypothetical protein
MEARDKLQADKETALFPVRTAPLSYLKLLFQESATAASDIAYMFCVQLTKQRTSRSRLHSPTNWRRLAIALIAFRYAPGRKKTLSSWRLAAEFGAAIYPQRNSGNP